MPKFWRYKKAAEFSGSISCRRLAGDFIFACLPGLARQIKNLDNFAFWLSFSVVILVTL